MRKANLTNDEVFFAGNPSRKEVHTLVANMLKHQNEVMGQFVNLRVNAIYNLMLNKGLVTKEEIDEVESELAKAMEEDVLARGVNSQKAE